MAIKLYGLSKCSTCLKAQAWLDEKKISYTFQDYRDVPIVAKELKTWAESLGGWEKLVNRASMTWRGLDERLKSPTTDKEWLSLIAQYPALIRRPVAVLSDHSVMVGFNEKRYAEQCGVL